MSRIIYSACDAEYYFAKSPLDGKTLLDGKKNAEYKHAF